MATSHLVTLEHSGSGVNSVIGTANQIVASSPDGDVTLSLPQSINTTSSPTFAKVTLTNLSIGAAPGIDGTVTTAGLVGKTMTFVKGVLTGFA